MKADDRRSWLGPERREELGTPSTVRVHSPFWGFFCWGPSGIFWGEKQMEMEFRPFWWAVSARRTLVFGGAGTNGDGD